MGRYAAHAGADDRVRGAERAGALAAAIVGVAGPELDDAERRLFAARAAVGLHPVRPQLRGPGAGAAGWSPRCAPRWAMPQAPVLIDQEGGRVMRLRPPHWPARPPLRSVGRLAEDDPAAGREAAWLHARLIAADLHAARHHDRLRAGARSRAAGGHRRDRRSRAVRRSGAGRRARPGADRGLSRGRRAAGDQASAGPRPRPCRQPSEPAGGRRAARAACAARDWQPFRACRAAPLAITAHVRFAALDPAQPATLSARVIGEVIRGELGFAGLLLSDDLSMGALTGSLGERAAAARAAGCDLALHCNGRLRRDGRRAGGGGPARGRGGSARGARARPAAAAASRSIGRRRKRASPRCWRAPPALAAAGV